MRNEKTCFLKLFFRPHKKSLFSQKNNPLFFSILRFFVKNFYHFYGNIKIKNCIFAFV